MDWTGVKEHLSVLSLQYSPCYIICRDEGMDGELWTCLAEQVESELWEAKQLKINLILVDLYH